MSQGHTHVVEGETLTPVEAHLADILGTVRPLPPTELSLGDADGLVLAEDVTASTPLPSFDNSAMDGYAVRVEDVAAASEQAPVTLPVVAEVAAGDTGAYALQAGTAIRIMTGAMLPHGTEAVIPVEWTDGGKARVAIRDRAERGHAIRLAGGDARAGEVLSTGSELAEPGTPIVPGRIWDSNSFMIAAAAREAGCLAYRQAIVPDRPEEVLPAIEDQLVRADLMITTGGVSMGGEYDVVKAALQQLGTIEFRKVAMQPGMPQGFGTVALPASAAQEDGSRPGLLGRLADRGEVPESPVRPGEHDHVPIFTLPGNPVSAYVSFQVFVRPAIGALQAYGGLGLEEIRAELTGPVRSPPGRRSFLRGVLDRSRARITPLTGQGSHQVATLGKANALIIVPDQAVRMAGGETADVLVLP